MTNVRACAVCEKRVYPGEGMYYRRRLIHVRCVNIAKIQRHML